VSTGVGLDLIGAAAREGAGLVTGAAGFATAAGFAVTGPAVTTAGLGGAAVEGATPALAAAGLNTIGAGFLESKEDGAGMGVCTAPHR
jgi:hypothetical protein